MHYRLDLFEDADLQAAFETEYGYPLAPPATLDQMSDMAAFFVAQDVVANGTQFAGKEEALAGRYYEILFANGGDYFDADLNPIFDSEAGIASAHGSAPTFAHTDWRRIVMLYGALAGVEPTPVVELNRAAAEAIAYGPARGLARMDRLAEPLAEYSYLHASRADLLRRLGRRKEAIVAYERAIRLTVNASQRRFLQRRLDELE